MMDYSGYFCGDCGAKRPLWHDWLCVDCRRDQDDFWDREVDAMLERLMYAGHTCIYCLSPMTGATCTICSTIPREAVTVEVYALQVTCVDGYMYVSSDRFARLGIENAEGVRRNIRKLKVA